MPTERIVLTCTQVVPSGDVCGERARYRMHWPGSAAKLVCQAHADKGQSTAGALGFALVLAPLDELEPGEAAPRAASLEHARSALRDALVRPMPEQADRVVDAIEALAVAVVRDAVVRGSK